MWIEINLADLGVRQQGLIRAESENELYASPTLPALRSVEGLTKAEYGQAVEIDRRERTVAFGRDYLGHFPLLYACTAETLLISDDLAWIVRRLRAEGVSPTLSEESLALYFTMAYVPCGMTLYREITACEAHTLYRWRNGRIEKTSTFKPVEIDPSCSLPDLERAIEREVARYAARSDEIDVWCSGGLDSSIMACEFNARGRRAELLTLGYGDHIRRNLGDGERRYAHDVAAKCGARIRDIELTAERFDSVHQRFVSTYPTPAIDVCVPPKYALAQASRSLVITGEGSDPLFGGPKNNVMVYAHGRNPAAPLGWHYAAAHERYAFILDKLMRRGEELKDYVIGYLAGLFERYPGDMIRKLFYINTHVKAASLIFTEGYYACRERNLAARHPYGSLGVYRTAFALADRFKYRYPKSKLALHDLYAGRLPASVVNRKKSGTVLPLRFYLSRLAPSRLEFAPLLETGLFAPGVVEHAAAAWQGEEGAGLLYSFVTLSEWLRHKAAGSASRGASAESALAA